VQIITDETFGKHQGFDLASFDEKHIPPSDLPSFRVLKDEPFSKFKQRVAEHFKYAPADFKLWVMVNRQNKTIRPDVPILDNESSQSQ
jgi:ubiquitin carboxyl-terminal hydrolase 7